MMFLKITIFLKFKKFAIENENTSASYGDPNWNYSNCDIEGFDMNHKNFKFCSHTKQLPSSPIKQAEF